MEGADVGKKADAHILQVKDKYIEVFQLLCTGLLVGSIQGDDGKACFGIYGVVDFLACIGSATKSMFGHKHFHYLNFIFQQKIDQMLLIGLRQDARLVPHYPYFFPLKLGEVELGLFGAHPNSLRNPYGAACQIEANGQNVEQG